MADVFGLIPGLERATGARDVDAAAFALELFEAVGAERFLVWWDGGRLAPLLATGAVADALGEARDVAATAHVQCEALQRELERVRRDSVAAKADAERQLEAIRATRAWRAASAFYRLRARELARARRLAVRSDASDPSS